MFQTLDYLEKLRQLSGNAQIDYLDSIKNDLIRQVLEYTYDPQKKYKINEGKFDKFVPFYLHTQKKSLTQIDWQDYVKLLDMLLSIKSAKDDVVKEIVRFIYSFEQFDYLKI